MKKKVSVLIEEDVIRQAKHCAAEEGRPLSSMIQDALVSYLRKKITGPGKGEEAYQLFCERPMHLNRTQFKEIMGEEPWG